MWNTLPIWTTMLPKWNLYPKDSQHAGGMCFTLALTHTAKDTETSEYSAVEGSDFVFHTYQQF